MRWLFAVSLTALLAVLVSAQYHPLSDDFIDKINKDATTWKAGRNFNEHLSRSYFKGLMGALPTPKSEKLPILYHSKELLQDLPSEFDSRKAWPQCPSLEEIRDQGNCGSCWAISSVEVMTDRACIHSNGSKQFHYSVEDLMTCCAYCGYSCDGGVPSSSFRYWVEAGIVSGGPYNSSHGCQPYDVPPCEHHIHGPRPDCGGPQPSPSCVQQCESGYSVSYEQDLHKAKSAYGLIPDDINQIMTEIMKNGPVSATFDVYDDFLHYKSGVYKYTHGDILGGHAIKILGWGEENGVKYWLCANSWNTDWGDKGFFKILRGVNECGIEYEISAGLPAAS